MISELSKRRVFRVVAGYSVVCFVVLQIADVTFEPLGITNDVLRLMIAGMMLGLPIVAYLAWVFDVEEGASVKRTASRSPWLEATIAVSGLVLFAIGAWFIFRADNEVTAADSGEAGSSFRQSAPTSIAVLPFANLSNDPEQEYFSDGVAEDILISLAAIPEIIVRPRSSSFVFRGSEESFSTIGAQLKVSHILEGSVRKSSGTIRVSARLVDVAEERTLWSDTYTEELRDIFEVQDAITGEILSQLQLELGLARGSGQSIGDDAYDALLRGRYIRQRGDYNEAERWFARATELRADYADAWAMRALVSAYQSATGFAPNSGAHLAKRLSYIANALEHDPDNAIALGTRALMDTHYRERNYEAAIAELVRLAAKHPNDIDLLFYLSYIFTAIGRADLVDRVTERAVELAPLSRTAIVIRAAGLSCVGPESKFRAIMDRMSTLGVTTPSLLTNLAEFNGDSASARAISESSYPMLTDDFFLYARALAAYLDGDRATARDVIRSAQPVDAYRPHFLRYQMALVESDNDKALQHFRLGIQDGEQLPIQQSQGCLADRKVFPEFFADPRYMDVLRDYGLDPEAIVKIKIPPLPF